ncbi:unnamed protein product [Rotaria socialis]|uniref:Asparagine synthetase [glutamine-hydrolyzing] n=1 Tax=Rotaria socialis TaxID=392032 RepID=A0A818L3U1_9BILA|nr:unnamed protein product [Rotaria socialis]CAF3569056.1 unnamed protein product [Rotaria socialis]CAF4164222.1 unnamed protein product [Rotaria socialis]CAF4453746.1 unnamed protein product [Rotaria socialis]
MCGICFCLHTQSTPLSIDYTPLNARGPDFQTQHGPISLTSNLYVTFAVSVLALRGYKQQQQPFIDEDGNILLLNGEIYEGALQISADDNDGVVLSQHLKRCSTDIDICNLISALEGCFAFIYFQKKTNSLYYGRDRLGRRSLLYSTETDPPSNIKMILSSVQLNNLSYTELDSNILHKLTVIEADHTFKIDFIPYVNRSIDRIVRDPPDTLLNELESNSEFQTVSKIFLNQLQNAVQRRVINIPSLCRQCKQFADSILRPLDGCQHAKLAILFSGGIDSTVLAALVDRVLPINEPIDLLNVAFFSAVSAPPADRQTGLQALTELNPERRWNFVKIDINLNELQHYRESIIKNVLYPCSTVLDDSIGSALWFAARGNGILHQDNIPYESLAEVLLSGLGADEQLAGYSRHRSTFQTGGWKALENELDMEMNRISKRNLGRDDRVISSLGKEGRFPFLDEQFVNYLHSIPIWLKADLRLARGIGEKYLLRYVARHYLSLEQSSKYPKRAIQFGSRIAKLESRKEKASDQCSRLTTTTNNNFMNDEE